METTNAFKRIHPLMATAAVAVIVASLTAVAAMTGLLPKSQGSANEQLQPSAPVASSETPKLVREAVKSPAVEPKRAASQPKVPARASSAPAERPAPVAAAPALKNVGTVESVRAITLKGEGTGLGAVAGGVLGAVVGNQLGNGRGQAVMTVAGAAGGAYAGHEIEKHKRGTKRWEISVRMEDGTLRTVSTDIEPSWRAGDRVRVVSGTLQPA